MIATNSLMTRTARSRAMLLAFALLIPVACTDVTGVATQDEDTPITEQSSPQPVSGGDVYYSFTEEDGPLISELAAEGAAGPRWCSQKTSWIDPSALKCVRFRFKPPFGEVAVGPEGLRVGAGDVFVAPFLWSAGPNRPDPFPAEEDFALDVRLTVEQAGTKAMGLQVLRWVPARTDGGYDPLAAKPVLQILADVNGLAVSLLGRPGVAIADPLAPHAYQLVYKGGEYTVFVDGELVDGPVASERRPNAFWLGSPLITWWWGDWSDVLLSEMTVSLLDETVEVPFDIKPGGCPSPLSLKARGVLPAAIMGTAELNVADIDVKTIQLEGIAPIRYALEDVGAPAEPFTGKTAEDCNADGPDGIPDLTLKFDNRSVVALVADPELRETRTLTLTGKLLDGSTEILGEDVVIVVK